MHWGMRTWSWTPAAIFHCLPLILSKPFPPVTILLTNFWVLCSHTKSLLSNRSLFSSAPPLSSGRLLTYLLAAFTSGSHQKPPRDSGLALGNWKKLPSVDCTVSVALTAELVGSCAASLSSISAAEEEAFADALREAVLKCPKTPACRKRTY